MALKSHFGVLQLRCGHGSLFIIFSFLTLPRKREYAARQTGLNRGWRGSTFGRHQKNRWQQGGEAVGARIKESVEKQIVADYLETGSYRETARNFRVSDSTVKRIIADSSDFERMLAEKRQKDTADVLHFMERKREVVCEIIEKGLNVLNDEEKLAQATPAQITTAIGTLIDKWTNMQKVADSSAVSVELGAAEEFSE